MKIEVTEDDIKLGERWNTKACPIALAINRITKSPASEDVFVGLNWAWIGKNELKLPTEAVNFIDQFDAGLEVHPISFNMELA